MGGRAIALASMGVAAVALAVVVGSSPLLIGNDSPVHLYTAFVANHLDDPDAAFGRYYALNTPITMHGFHEPFRLLEPFLGWRDAYRVTLVILAELFALSFAAGMFVAGGWRRWPVALLGFGLAPQWALTMGLFAFVLGTGLAVFAATWMLGPARRPLLFSVLLLGAALCHPLPAALAGAAALLAALSSRSAPHVVVTILAGAPAGFIALLSTEATVAHSTTVSWAALSERGPALLAAVQPGSRWVACVVVAVVIATVISCVRHKIAPAVAVYALVLVSAPLWLPLTLRGWDFAGLRTVGVGVGIACALIPLERWRAAERAAAAVASILWVAAALATSSALLTRIDRAVAPALTLLDAAPRAGVFRQTLLLTKLSPTGVPYLNPLLQIGHLYALVDGGAAPWIQQGSQSVHEVRGQPALPTGIEQGYIPAWKAGADGDDEATHAFKRDQLQSWSRGFERILVFGRPGDVDAIGARGWRTEAREGELALMEFVGCDVTLTAPPRPRPWRLSVGPAAGAVAAEVTIEVDAGEALTAPLERLSCGPARLVATPGCAVPDVTLAPGAVLECALP